MLQRVLLQIWTYGLAIAATGFTVGPFFATHKRERSDVVLAVAMAGACWVLAGYGFWRLRNTRNP
jgi:hypothetical protein